MPKKRYTPEEIVAKLRQVDVLVSQGQNIADAIRQIGMSEVTYYRWRQEYGGLKTEQVKRLKELETVESFNARLRDELLDGEIFYTLREAQIVIESWRRHFNTIRPHESLGYKPPAPEVFVQAFAAWPAALEPAPPATLPLAQRPTLN